MRSLNNCKQKLDCEKYIEKIPSRMRELHLGKIIFSVRHCEFTKQSSNQGKNH